MIVGDRFVQTERGWRCLATGLCAALQFHSTADRSPSSDSQAVGTAGAAFENPVRLDSGEHGAGRWFEATADARDVCAFGSERAQHLAEVVRVQRAAGFVVVDPTIALPAAVRRALRHRHLALVADDETRRRAAARWLVELSLVSDREHRVLTDGMPVPRSRPRELSLVYSALRPSRAEVRERQPMGALQLERALVYVRRRRVGSAEQWYGAGIAAARRRGDSPGMVAGASAWVGCLLGAARFSRAIDVAERLLLQSADEPESADVAALAGRAHLDAGHLARACTYSRLAATVAALFSREPSNASVALRAECRFWAGVPADGLAELAKSDAAADSGPPGTRWRDLLIWGQGRSEGQPDALAAARGGHEHDRWRRAIALQHRSEGIEAANAAPLDEPDGLLRPMFSRGLVDVVLIRVLDALGLASRADVAWMESFGSTHQIRGLDCWGRRKADMQTLQHIAELLDIAQTTEDELQGLRRMCDWARSTVSADAVTLLCAPVGGYLAGDPVSNLRVDPPTLRAWLDDGEAGAEERGGVAIVRAPIRFAGVHVGQVLLSGATPRARAMIDCARAIGAVAGPLVRARIDALASASGGDALADSILGTAPAIVSVRASVARAAAVPFPVLIEGESGTGKELVARALHRLSPRRSRAFAALNCAALADELAEAELFGHAKGAFTHAVAARAGLFEQAHQGTLFLDEIADLSARAQAKLLRALQEGEIRRIGENDSRSVDVRVVAATNRPLAGLAADGRFREDLLFRLSVIRIVLPPLRERAEDVAPLAVSFWRGVSRRAGTKAVLAPDALALLSSLPWPGNVRQLQNTMAALAVAAPAYGRVGARLVRHVIDARDDGPEIVPLEEARRAMERRLVAAALARHTGNRADAARALGLSRQGLAKALRRLGLGEAGVA